VLPAAVLLLRPHLQVRCSRHPQEHLLHLSVQQHLQQAVIEVGYLGTCLHLTSHTSVPCTAGA
jgi:hypothetical protein